VTRRPTGRRQRTGRAAHSHLSIGYYRS